MTGSYTHQADDTRRAPEHVGVGRLGVRPDAPHPEHGHGPGHGVAPTATAPQGWTVKFDPETVDVAPAGEASVVAHITPSSDAIAGDYLVTFKATSDLASSSADIRVTIQTGLSGRRDRARR